VEQCGHPTLVQGLCVVCGQAVRPNNNAGNSNNNNPNNTTGNYNPKKNDTTESHNDNNNNNNNNTTDQQQQQQQQQQQRLTVSGGVTLNISHQEARRIAHENRQRLHSLRKLSLVLDLDHTLVHATQDKRAQQYCCWNGSGSGGNRGSGSGSTTASSSSSSEEQPEPEPPQQPTTNQQVRSLLLPLLWNSATESAVEETNNTDNPNNNKNLQLYHLPHYLKLRPHVREFLQSTSPRYELSVYTAGTRAYAQQVMAILARHYVNVSRDEPDLQQLQGRVQQHEAQLQHWRKMQLFVDQEESTHDEKEEATKSTMAETTTRTEKEPSQPPPPPPPPRQDDDNGACNKKTEADDANGPCCPATAALDTNNDAPKEAQGESAPSSAPLSAPPEEDHNNKINSKKKKKKKGVSFGALPPKPTPQKPTASELEQWIREGEQELKTLQEEWDRAQRDEQKAQQACQKLFGGRIVSRTDTAGEMSSSVKNIKRMFPCGGSMAVIVDDREDVWSHADNYNTAATTNDNDDSKKDAYNVPSPQPGEPPHNLLLCRPYHWGPFAGFADINNAAGEDLSEMGSSGPSKKEQHKDNDKDDHQLLWTADTLKRLHEAYYNYNDNKEQHDNVGEQPRPTVPEVVYRLRHNVLQGSNMLLSGLVPLHRQQQNDGGRPRPRPNFLRHAENLGAVVQSNVSSSLTHVVAAKDGTEKVLAARRVPGCVVVKPAWLMECVWTLTRREEKPHVMKGPVGRAPPPPPHPPNHSAAPLAAPPVLGDRNDASSPNDDLGQNETVDADMLPRAEEKEAVDTNKENDNGDDDDDDDDEFAAAFEMELEEDDDDDDDE